MALRASVRGFNSSSCTITSYLRESERTFVAVRAAMPQTSTRHQPTRPCSSRTLAEEHTRTVARRAPSQSALRDSRPRLAEPLVSSLGGRRRGNLTVDTGNIEACARDADGNAWAVHYGQYTPIPKGAAAYELSAGGFDVLYVTQRYDGSSTSSAGEEPRHDCRRTTPGSSRAVVSRRIRRLAAPSRPSNAGDRFGHVTGSWHGPPTVPPAGGPSRSPDGV
jgi:hypothetical protein